MKLSECQSLQAWSLAKKGKTQICQQLIPRKLKSINDVQVFPYNPPPPTITTFDGLHRIGWNKKCWTVAIWSKNVKIFWPEISSIQLFPPLQRIGCRKLFYNMKTHGEKWTRFTMGLRDDESVLNKETTTGLIYGNQTTVRVTTRHLICWISCWRHLTGQPVMEAQPEV